jgi:serine/threonine-protein kinase RsbT
VEEEIRITIESDEHVLNARQKGRALAAWLGFSSVDLTLIVTAISEIARNIASYAQQGEMILRPVQQGPQKGIVVIACDQGPGIPDLDIAMQDGYSTSGSLGLGLPGARRLMDDFEIVSTVGKGTCVTMKKWVR